MVAKITALRWAAGLLVAAGPLAGCGAITGDDSPQARGDVLGGGR